MEAENGPLEKEKHLQTTMIFWVLCLFSGVYISKYEIPKMQSNAAQDTVTNNI